MLIIRAYITILGFVKIVTLKNRKTFIYVASTVLFIIAALRSPYFGPDTLGYVNKFNSFQYVNISVFLNDLISFNGKDPSFVSIIKDY